MTTSFYLLPCGRELPFMSADTTATPKTTVSERRLAANRANTQLSTGPRTPEGKAKSSLNAVKTGLAGRTVLLSTLR